MRITNLHVENFLTFNSLDLKFQKNPTIFIGPNGSGKTNIIRILEFVDSTLWNRNLVPQSVGYFKITLKLVLSKKELNLIKQYLQLIMLIHETQLLPSLVKLSKEEKKRIIKNIIDLKGEFFNVNDNITIEIEGYNESVTSRKIQLYWNNEDRPYTLTENNELLIFNAVNIGSVNLKDLLPLINSEEIPDPKTLLQRYEQNYNRQNPNSTASFYKIVLLGFPLEDFSDYFPYIGAWFNGEELEEVASKFGNLYESFNREIKSRKFIRINGREISLFHIIATIFSSALIVLKNPRKKLSSGVPLIEEETSSPNANSQISPFNNVSNKNLQESSPSIQTYGEDDVGKILFELKNNRDGYKKYKKIEEEFSKLDHNNNLLVWIDDTKNIHLGVELNGSNKIIPIEYFSSGEIELIDILTAVIGNSEKVIILDEPAQNMHPQMQQRLANLFNKEIIGRDNQNQIIIITHSPQFVQPFNLDQVIRLSKPNGDFTLVHHIEDLLQDKDKGHIRKWLVRSPQLRNALFSDLVVLCEGYDEEFVLNYYLNDIAEDKEVSIVNVEGQGGFNSFKEILEDLEIPYILYHDNKDKQAICEDKNSENKNNSNKNLCNDVKYNYSDFVEALKDIDRKVLLEACKTYYDSSKGECDEIYDEKMKIKGKFKDTKVINYFIDKLEEMNKKEIIFEKLKINELKEIINTVNSENKAT